MSRRTLKAIRRGAPEQDRNDPALVAGPLPEKATGTDGSSYVHIRFFPRSLNELRKFSRGFGRPAARDAEWACVTLWLMKSPAEADFSNPLPVVRSVTLMVRDHDRRRFGWPTPDGAEWKPSPFDFLSPDVQAEALRVAAETLCDWRKAGRPYLAPHRIKGTYQYLVSCPAFIERYMKEQQQ